MQNSFIQETIFTLNPIAFHRLKEALVGKYISFHTIGTESVTQEILAEKLHDYFEKIYYKTGKKFADQLKAYMAVLDSVVEPNIAKNQQAKKNEPAPPVYRSRKYYEKAAEIRKSMKSMSGLIDYTRLTMCLYAAIIRNGGEKIKNLDFALSSLDPDAIETALRAENESVLFGKKNSKPRFDTSDPYSMDSYFFVIAIILLYAIIGDSLEEGIDNE